MNGLAVYGPNSGAVLQVEAVALPAEKPGGGVQVTGVMEEEELGRPGRSLRRRSQARSSLDNVLTVLKSALGLRPQDYDIHVNFPGGIPVDGPSAGVSMIIAIASALTKKTVSNRVAMTGEVTIHGLIKGVGGIAPKLRAAQEAGIEKVLLPAESWQEAFSELTELEVIPVGHIAEVVQTALLNDGGLPSASLSPGDYSALLAAAPKTTPG